MSLHASLYISGTTPQTFSNSTFISSSVEFSEIYLASSSDINSQTLQTALPVTLFEEFVEDISSLLDTDC